MKYEFKPENLGERGKDKWMNAAITLHKHMGNKAFTVQDIKRLYSIDGNQAMTLLSYMVEHRLVRWLG
jgi:hypothetical protein